MKLFLLILIFPLYLFSFHDYHNHDEEKNENSNILEATLTSTEPFIKYVYDTVNTTAKTIDEFISNDYTPMEYNDSYVHIEMSARKEESRDLDFNNNVNIKIKLKKTKRKFKLFIDNSDDQVSEGYKDSNETVPYQDDDYNIGLQYDSFKRYLNFKVKLGVKASTDPYVFIKLSANKKFMLTENSHFYIEQNFKYSDKYDLDATSTLHYERILNESFTFSNFNQYFINSEQKIDNLYNSLRVNQKLSRKNYMNYVASVSSDNNTTKFQTKTYKTYVSYRHFIKKWFYFDLIPELNWQRSNDFRDKSAITFNLGILIDK